MGDLLHFHVYKFCANMNLNSADFQNVKQWNKQVVNLVPKQLL